MIENNKNDDSNLQEKAMNAVANTFHHKSTINLSPRIN